MKNISNLDKPKLYGVNFDNRKDNKTVSYEAQDFFFTRITKDDGILTKNIKLVNGSLEKDASECRMNIGKAETGKMKPEKFASWLTKIKSNQAIVHGVSVFNKAAIVSKKQLKTKAVETPQKDENGLPIISRSKDFFHYPDGPGLLMLDHDKARHNAISIHDKALQAYHPEELINTIAGFYSAIKEATWVSSCSTSSCIYDATTGEELRGQEAGFHLYLFPRNASDIPRFLKILGQRLMLAGYGRIEFSRSGAVLERTLIDLLVASPERLDFVAGAVCDNGLEQRLPDPVYHPGGLLDTKELNNLTPTEEEAYQEIIRELKEKGTSDQERIKAAYLEQEAKKLSSGSGGKISMEQARQTVKDRQHHILDNIDLLFFAHEEKPVTVAYVLENGSEFDKKSCSDPLEPEYGNSRSTAKFYWNDGKPIINSYAHGGVKYSFKKFKNEPDQQENFWDFKEVVEILENENLSAWCCCEQGKLNESQRIDFAIDILENNKFDSLRLGTIKDLISKQFGINKGYQQNLISEVQNTRRKEALQAEQKIDCELDATHAQIAEAFIKKEFDSTACAATEGKFWIYQNESGIYKAKKPEKMGCKIGEMFSGKYCKRNNDYKAISEFIYSKEQDDDFFRKAPVGLPCKSAFYEVQGNEIVQRPYVPELRQRFKLKHDPVKGLPKDSLLSLYLVDTFRDKDTKRSKEQVELLQMIIGGTVTGCFAEKQIAVLLYGGGENGKSVILEMIQHLMPEHLCAAVRPDKFKEEYSKAQLAGAYVNIVGELERDKPLSSEFKDIVGGDQRQAARQPYCPVFTFQPRAAHIFASNYFPPTRDHSHGFYRRWRIIKFNNVVDQGKKILHLGKMIVEEEGQYLTAWALKGAQKLKKHGVNLPETVCHKEALQEWQNEQDTFKGFFADRETIEPKDGSNIPLAELFQEYQKWCSSNRRSSLGKQNFNKRVKQQFQTKRISNKNSLPDWCFVGESTLF